MNWPFLAGKWPQMIYPKIDGHFGGQTMRKLWEGEGRVLLYWRGRTKNKVGKKKKRRGRRKTGRERRAMLDKQKNPESPIGGDGRTDGALPPPPPLPPTEFLPTHHHKDDGGEGGEGGWVCMSTGSATKKTLFR